MTVDQFFTKYNGKYLDYDGVYGAQCVDLIKYYYRDVLGIPAQRGNAIDYWYNYPTKHLNKIKNTLSFVPRKGDIFIFNWGTYGHIGICTGKGNTTYFQGFEQNFPTGARVGYHNHSYRGFLGVLRPAKLNPPKTTTTTAPPTTTTTSTSSSSSSSISTSSSTSTVPPKPPTLWELIKRLIQAIIKLFKGKE